MDSLSDFFRDNSLTVSLNKTEWLVGGKSAEGKAGVQMWGSGTTGLYGIGARL